MAFAGAGTVTDPAISPFHIRMTSINGTHNSTGGFVTDNNSTGGKSTNKLADGKATDKLAGGNTTDLLNLSKSLMRLRYEKKKKTCLV